MGLFEEKNTKANLFTESINVRNVELVPSKYAWEKAQYQKEHNFFNRIFSSSSDITLDEVMTYIYRHTKNRI